MTGTAQQPSERGPAEATLDEVVALCKRRGFVFQSSEIYGGLGSTYDYGHYGVLLRNNVKGQWWRGGVVGRDDIVGPDSAIPPHPPTPGAAGAPGGFTHPLGASRPPKQPFPPREPEGAP